MDNGQRLDFEQGGPLTGDSGERGNDAEGVDSIKPIDDGERAAAANFVRPSENIRRRTEVLRDGVERSLYTQDSNFRWVMSGGDDDGLNPVWPTISWNVSAGTFETTSPMVIQPLNTPRLDMQETAVVPFDDGVHSTDFEFYPAPAKRAYNGANLIRVIWLEDTAANLASASVSGKCDAVVSGDPKRILTITIVDDGSADTTDLTTALTAVAADITSMGLEYTLTSPDPTNTLMQYADIVAAGMEDFQFSGNYDKELHYIPQSTFSDFFGGNALADGDTLSIAFAEYVDETGTTGRRQRIPANSNTTLYDSDLFITSNNAENIPLSIPLCKRIGDDLYWFDGTLITASLDGIPVYPGENGFSIERVRTDIWGTDATITGHWRFDSPISFNAPIPADPALLYGVNSTTTLSADTSFVNWEMSITGVTDTSTPALVAQRTQLTVNTPSANDIGRAFGLFGDVALTQGIFNGGYLNTSAAGTVGKMTVNGGITTDANTPVSGVVAQLSYSGTGATLAGINAGLHAVGENVSEGSNTAAFYGAYVQGKNVGGGNAGGNVYGQYTQVYSATGTAAGVDLQAHEANMYVVGGMDTSSTLYGYRLSPPTLVGAFTTASIKGYSSELTFGSSVSGSPSAWSYIGDLTLESGAALTSAYGQQLNITSTDVVNASTIYASQVNMSLGEDTTVGGIRGIDFRVTHAGAASAVAGITGYMNIGSTSDVSASVAGQDLYTSVSGSASVGSVYGIDNSTRLVAAAVGADVVGIKNALTLTSAARADALAGIHNVVTQEYVGNTVDGTSVYGVYTQMDIPSSTMNSRQMVSYYSAVNWVSNEVQFDTYSTTAANATSIRLLRSNSFTIGAYVPPDTGDALGEVTFYGVNSAAGVQESARIDAEVYDTPGAATCPGAIAMRALNCGLTGLGDGDAFVVSRAKSDYQEVVAQVGTNTKIDVTATATTGSVGMAAATSTYISADYNSSTQVGAITVAAGGSAFCWIRLSSTAPSGPYTIEVSAHDRIDLSSTANRTVVKLPQASAATGPASAVLASEEADMYWDNNLKKLRIFDGSSWLEIGPA